MAAPKGNQYGTKARIWSAAINRVLDSREPRSDQMKAIDELAEVLIEKCYDGDLSALVELGNRLEGKPAQTVAVGQDAELGPIQHAVIELVRPKG